MRMRSALLGLSGIAMVGACSSAAVPASGKEQAASHGYTRLTFHTGQFDASDIDVHDTHAPGFSWYIWNFFSHSQPPGDVTLNDDGSVSVLGTKGRGTLVSAAQTGVAPYFVGKAFGGGGYFEAEIAFDAARVNTDVGWPAWWGLTLESVLNEPSSYWKGQAPGYRNSAELDIFEYDVADIIGNPSSFGTGLHHWYGVRGQCLPKPLCDYGTKPSITNRILSYPIDWSKYHKLAALWVPATKTSQGSMTFFLDDKQLGAPVPWSQFNDQPPPPSSSKPWTFGVLDRMHLILVLNSGRSTPMKIRSVSVWQATDKDNVQN